MNIKNWFHSWLSTHVSAEHLARSCAVGAYIAFSPYLFLHTLMAIGAIWLFGLHAGMVLAATYGINNLWTLVPIYWADYFFGHWLVHTVLQWDVTPYTPSFLQTWNLWLEHNLGITAPCVWSFFIGGNILGALVGLGAYGLCKWLLAGKERQA